MKIERVQQLINKLRDRAAKAQKDNEASAFTGYSASYAIYVHENIEMKLQGQARTTKGFYWDPQGQAQAKFLEQPARELSNSGELSRVVKDILQKGGTMAQALVAGCLRIQRESMLLCPVDTGALKASAFTKLESGGG